jgi:hypothetical protein
VTFGEFSTLANFHALPYCWYEITRYGIVTKLLINQWTWLWCISKWVRELFLAHIIPTISARQFETAKTKNYPVMTLSKAKCNLIFVCCTSFLSAFPNADLLIRLNHTVVRRGEKNGKIHDISCHLVSYKRNNRVRCPPWGELILLSREEERRSELNVALIFWRHDAPQSLLLWLYQILSVYSRANSRTSGGALIITDGKQQKADKRTSVPA